MSDLARFPRLAPWLEPGVVPGELKRLLRNEEIAENIRVHGAPTGELQAGPTGFPSEFSVYRTPPAGSVRGVALLSEKLLTEWREKKSQDSRASGRAAIQWMGYALLLWCTVEKEAPPFSLMRLLFETLDLVESNPSKGVAERLRFPLATDEFEKFHAAVQKDVDHVVANGRAMSENGLAGAIGVARPTVNRWRSTPDYKRIRENLVFMRRLQERRSGA